MYQRLKERALRQVRAELVSNGHHERVVFLAGRRRGESARRESRQIPEVERIGSVVWVSPLIHWTAADMAAYRLTYDVPRNEVSDLLHMSGECLCGAFAHAGELDEIGFWYPEVRAEIEALADDVASDGRAPTERCTWGWGAYRDRAPTASRSGPMCSSCEAPS